MSALTAPPRSAVRAQPAHLAELVAALSLASDLALGQPLESGLGTCLLATRLGEAIGLGTQELKRTYYLALLQHVGCTVMNHELAAMVGDEISARAGAASIDLGDPAVAVPYLLGVFARAFPSLAPAQALARVRAAGQLFTEGRIAACEVGQMLAERFGSDGLMRRDLGMVFERWDGRGVPGRAGGEDLSLPLRVVHVAEGARALYDAVGEAGAVDCVSRMAGGAYEPGIADAFLRSAPGLLSALETPSRWDEVMRIEPGGRLLVGDEGVDGVLRAIAEFVDLKSPYLVGHSAGVAELAAEAGRRAGLPDDEVVALRRAGWVHDLGRVAVSSGVWSKAGPLTSAEREQVRLHAYHTDRVFARVGWHREVFALASTHHERIDGSGYFRGTPASGQSPAVRILAAADAYRAMTEPRPHRPAMTAAEAAAELRSEVRLGRIDADAASAVLEAAGERPRRRRTRVADLTAREVEVLRLVARGLSTREVADALVIAPKTVDKHIQTVYMKAGVSSRAAATLFAVRHDLLD